MPKELILNPSPLEKPKILPYEPFAKPTFANPGQAFVNFLIQVLIVKTAKFPMNTITLDKLACNDHTKRPAPNWGQPDYVQKLFTVNAKNPEFFVILPENLSLAIVFRSKKQMQARKLSRRPAISENSASLFLNKSKR